MLLQAANVSPGGGASAICRSTCSARSRLCVPAMGSASLLVISPLPSPQTDHRAGRADASVSMRSTQIAYRDVVHIGERLILAGHHPDERVVRGACAEMHGPAG